MRKKVKKLIEKHRILSSAMMVCGEKRSIETHWNPGWLLDSYGSIIFDLNEQCADLRNRLIKMRCNDPHCDIWYTYRNSIYHSILTPNRPKYKYKKT